LLRESASGKPREASAAEPEQRKYRADIAAWKAKREALLDLIKQDARRVRRRRQERPSCASWKRRSRSGRACRACCWAMRRRSTWRARWRRTAERRRDIERGRHSVRRTRYEGRRHHAESGAAERPVGRRHAVGRAQYVGLVHIARRPADSRLQVQEATLREFFAQSRGWRVARASWRGS